MKTRGLMLTALVAAAGFGVPIQPLPGTGSEGSPDFFRDNRHGKGQRNRRGNGKRNPPKSRPNRLTISKRVRRKHRRSA